MGIIGFFDIKKVGSILLNYLFYFFAFLFVFFIIYRAYIYRFGLTPLPCMNERCIRERNNI